MQAYLYQPITLETGKTYQVSFSYSSDTNVEVGTLLYAGFSASADIIAQTDIGSLPNAVSSSIGVGPDNTGTASFQLTVGAGQDTLFLTTILTNGGNVTFDNVSVKKILLNITVKPSQLLVATNSLGFDYGIGVYGTDFYLADIQNSQWIKLNQSYTPAISGVFYGSTNWNKGFTDDRFYFGNGIDDTMKWIMGVTSLKLPANPTDTTVTLNNSKAFPTTGSIIIQNAGVQTVLAYTANNTTTGVLTLSGTVGTINPQGLTVVIPIVNVPAIPKDSVFAKSQGRLFGANAQGAENTIHYSVSGDPEDYTISSDVNSGGFYTVYKGKGGILGMTDYGQYLTIQKIDVISEFQFNIASDNSGFIVEVNPLISGDGIGPASASEILNYMNILYYPTIGEGIVSFSPAQTGVSTGSNLNLLSQKINNLVTEQFDFSLSRTCGLAQKLYWLTSLPTVGVPTTVNNLVLMYDLVRASQNPTLSAWTIFDNWNAVDIKPINGVLYYLSVNDGGLYESYQGFQDAVAGNVNPYISATLSKRFNLNSPATLMRGQYIYLEGIISLNTTFYVQALYNESGALGSQSYAIKGTNSAITSNTFTAGMGRFIMGSPLLGGVDLQTIQNQSAPVFFRVYLEVSQAYREHNIQLLCYSIAAGSQWGISKMILITQPETSIETALVTSPSSAPSITK